MLKKPLFLVGLLGVLIIIVGLILSPSFVGSFTSDGKIESLIRIIQVKLAQIYIVIFGAVLILGTIVFNSLPAEKRVSHFLIGTALIGLILAISGLIISPEFAQKNLSPQNFINEYALNFLSNFQIAVITLGCLLILTSLLILTWKLLKFRKTFSLIFTATSICLYLLLIYFAYLKIKFPNNIIFKPAQYGKTIDLLLGKEILLNDFEPKPSLVVERRHVYKSRYPVIDVHFHLVSDFRTDLDKEALAPDNLKKSLDSVNVKTIVNLDGFDIKKQVVEYHKKYPDKFVDFAYPPLGSSQLVDDKSLANLPYVVEDLVKRGAYGIGEFSKYLGISIKDESGKIIPIDDPRLDPFWSKISVLKVPILWHCADPTPFFQQVDRVNERFTELGRYPFWSYYKPGVPTKEELLKQQENVMKKHPDMLIIGAHMGMCADNLQHLGYLFDNYPNYYVDCSATLSELGRQPYTARKFFIKYQDRILFGSDGGALHGVKGWTTEKIYQAYYEFFETENEYIEYPMQGAINQGNWRIYGINLPDEVLKKLYYENARRILPNIFKVNH